MRNMSFMLTTEQVRRREKTVTRRIGWRNAKRGDVVQPVVKGQGLKKGEKVEKIGGPIRIVSVRRERLDAMATQDDYYRIDHPEVIAEGFYGVPGWHTPVEFISQFCQHNRCQQWDEITRIEFEYVDDVEAVV